MKFTQTIFQDACYHGLILVKKNEKYGFLDKERKLAIPCIRLCRLIGGYAYVEQGSLAYLITASNKKSRIFFSQWGDTTLMEI